MNNKAIQLDTIEFYKPLWVEEQLISTKIKATATKTINGNVVVFEQPNRDGSLNLTLSSTNDGLGAKSWISRSNAEDLISLTNGSLGSIFQLELQSGLIYNVRFRHEVEGGAVQLSHITVRDYFEVKIYLAREI